MKNVAKFIYGLMLLLLTGKGPLMEEAVDAGICDLSGQGRNQYGN